MSRLKRPANHLLHTLLGETVSHDTSSLGDPEIPVPDAQRIDLLSAYLQDTGTLCEVTDSTKHITVASFHTMMGSSAFVAAAMALASRQLAFSPWEWRASQLYQYSLGLLRKQNPDTADASILAARTLLCMYALMDPDTSDWESLFKVFPQIAAPIDGKEANILPRNTQSF